MRTYIRHRIFDVVEIKELIALEYLDFEGKYKNYSERHNFWELCYVDKSSVYVNLEGRSIELREGELLLIPPSVVHSYDSACGNVAEAFVVCFESSSSILKALGETRFESDEIAKTCMERLIYESVSTFRMDEEEHLAVLDKAAFGGQQAIISQLEYLLIHLIRMLSSANGSGVVFLSGDSFYLDLSNAVLDFFEEHVREDLTLDDVCRRMNYSRSFLCKTFKKQTGRTLMASFNDIKMREARILLEKTEWKLAYIAEYLGFSDAKYFGALFKKYMGVAPIEYRIKKKTSEASAK